MRFFYSATIASIFVSISLCGCALLPGFGLLEEPTLYYIPVAEVATQVACEMQEFMREHVRDPKWREQRWVLANEDVNVTLNLQTDTSGNVSFTGINVASLGFSSLQAFITSTASGKTTISSLTAKVQAKRSRTVKIAFSVSANALYPDMATDPTDQTEKAISCIAWERRANPATRLYLRDWLDNYFDTINYHYTSTATQDYFTDKFLASIRPGLPPEQVPTQFKIQSVDLTTSLQLVVDLTGGTTPTLLGNGTAFLLPVSGVSLDYSPDYSHSIDVTLKICNNTTTTTCYPKEDPKFPQITQLMREQCVLYAHLFPLLSGGVTVNPPKDAMDGDIHKTCNPKGNYVPARTKTVRQT